MNPIADGFKISDLMMPAVAFSQSEMADIFYNLRNDDSAPMLLESCTPEEADIRMNPGTDQVLEAVTAVYNRLDRTMSALVRVLNRYANTVQVVGAPFLGPNRKNNLFAYKTVTFTFSDEQTVSILFHSPGRDPLKFVPEDTLIAYRWMLNRRDITATVSPERGRDINLQTMARRIMQLVEENSQKFQERNAQRRQEEERFNQLQEESTQVSSKVEALTQENADLSTRIEDIDLMIARLKERLDNKELEQLQAQTEEPGVVEPNASDDSVGTLIDDVTYQLKSDVEFKTKRSAISFIQENEEYQAEPIKSGSKWLARYKGTGAARGNDGNWYYVENEKGSGYFYVMAPWGMSQRTLSRSKNLEDVLADVGRAKEIRDKWQEDYDAAKAENESSKQQEETRDAFERERLGGSLLSELIDKDMTAIKQRAKSTGNESLVRSARNRVFDAEEAADQVMRGEKSLDDVADRLEGFNLTRQALAGMKSNPQAENPEGEDADQNKYPENVVSVYLTQSGKKGAVIKSRGNGYSYSGEWGAGSLNADDMLKQVRQWKSSKRGLSLSYGVDFENHVSPKGASEQQFNFSAVIRDAEGNPYHVNSRRGFNANVAPIINGKPDIHNGNPNVDLGNYTFANEWWDADNNQIVVRSETQREEPTPAENTPQMESQSTEGSTDAAGGRKSLHDMDSKLYRDIRSSLDAIDDIDNGRAAGYERSLFASSIVNKLKTRAKNGDADLVDAALTYIAGRNQAASKDLITARNGVWKLTGKNMSHYTSNSNTTLRSGEVIPKDTLEWMAKNMMPIIIKEVHENMILFEKDGVKYKFRPANSAKYKVGVMNEFDDSGSEGMVGKEWNSVYGRQRIKDVDIHPTGDLYSVETVSVDDPGGALKNAGYSSEIRRIGAIRKYSAASIEQIIKDQEKEHNDIMTKAGAFNGDESSPQQSVAPEPQDQPPEVPTPEENAGETPVNENQNRADALNDALEQLLNETDAAKLEKDLDDLAEQAEAEGLMDELDAALNNAADRLSELLAQEAANVA